MDEPLELPHFDIDATVVKRLGEELISDEVSAIMELVKNAYDADADWVKITISTEGQVPEGMVYAGTAGYITLEDNGSGMTYQDILTKWLVISLSSKRDMKARNETTPKGRVPLGDKGVGRLSTQRLGRQLELISGVADREEWNHLAFDWADFESHVPLTKVRLQQRITPKKAKQKGTQLVITRLANQDIWKKEAADRFRGQLSQLIFPYKQHRPFSVYLTINGQKHDLDEISEDLQTQAIGRYQFRFVGGQLLVDGQISLGKLRGQSSKEEFEKFVLLDQGQDFFSFLTDSTANRRYFLTGIKPQKKSFFSFHRQLSFDKDFPGKSLASDAAGELVVANPGEFFGEIDEYDLRGTESTEEVFTGLKQYQSLVKNQVGIRVFRDGFGIKPYGFDGQDWLNLGGGQTSGGSFYGLRPNNVIGFVSISMAGNAQLKELTSREGFTDSPYSRNFMLVMQRVVKEVSEVLERTRRSYLDYKKTVAERVTGFKSIAEPVALLKQTSQQATAVDARSRQAERKFNDLSLTVKKQVDRLQNEPLFAAAGETASLPLLREVEGMVSEGAKLFAEINVILDKAKKWEESATYVSTQVANLESQLVQFTELAGLGLTAEALTHDIYFLLDRINTYTDNFNKQLGRASVPASVYEFMEYVRSFSRDLRKQLTHLAPSLRFNREKRETLSMNEFVETVRDYYTARFSTAGIKLIIETRKDFTVVANKGKLTQIFDNLFLNAEYWLRERQKSEPNFSPEIKVEINEPVVRVSDNGYGVAENLEDTLFQPFITAKPAEVGRGLGLFIVQQLLESMGGDIFLLQTRNALHRRYIFQLNLDAAIQS
ncbi:sensor histidine kinase [Hymenobacter metallilatus]|uniref:histidine kinase n=1 Tax=Hymenobacter metallilatus TaxID=2493666 RepID=A0A3R9MLK1_9BACT|nr:sensor histidine kinase [Hymenobacter metallilatus]RSK24918.1 sensor histidine kinase [Hymenobacter metallilatus]